MLLDALRLPLFLSRPQPLPRRVPVTIDSIDHTTVAVDPWRVDPTIPTELYRAGLVRALAGGLPGIRALRIGTRSEAWVQAESGCERTRTALELLVRARLPESLAIEVSSASPLVARDADLLGRLDQHQVVRVRVRVGSKVAQWLEAVRRLASEGLEVEVALDVASTDPFALVDSFRRAGATTIATTARRRPHYAAALLVA